VDVILIFLALLGIGTIVGAGAARLALRRYRGHRPPPPQQPKGHHQ